jgi:hypothetical protein
MSHKITPNSKIELVVYKGDEVVAVGGIHECAAKTGSTPEALYYYTMPAYYRKIEKQVAKLKAAGVEDIPDDRYYVVRTDREDNGS